MDIYYFKDSGINFAEGLGLKTRFTYGNPTFDYRDYSQYPPLYPLIFGVYTKIAGVSAVANQVFNSLIAVLTGLVGFAALHPALASVFGRRYRAGAEVLVGLLCVLTGYYGFTYDRPDGMATALGMGALVLALRGTGFASALAAGALCGLALFTSPYAGIWTSFGVALSLLTPPVGALSFRLRRLFCVGLAGVITVFVILGMLRLWLPGWFDGFFGVATGSNTHNETGGGYFLALLKGDLSTWWSGFSFAGPETYVPLGKLCAVDFALVWTLLVELRGGGGSRALWPLPLLALSPLSLLTSPYQANYLTMTAGLLLAAWASIEGVTSVKSAVQSRTPLIALLAAFVANIVVTAPFEIRDQLVRWNAGKSIDTAIAFLDSHRGMLESQSGFTAVSPTSYILWRQAGLHPLIEIYSGFKVPENRARLNMLALSYPGSGNPLLPQSAEYIPINEFALMSQPTLPQPAIVLGRSLSNSSQTWESAIYIRRP